MSGPIWFLTTAFEAAWPFLLLAAITSALVAIHDWIERGLTRRRQRFQGGQR